MLTEEEAKTKWCPFARERDCVQNSVSLSAVSWNRAGEARTPCIGSACMAWRWQFSEFDHSELARGQREKFPPHGRGFCGLAGKP